MAARVTQSVRAVPAATAAAGGAPRVTQIAKAAVVDLGTPQAGGTMRVTQVVRVVIGTIVLRRGPAILTAAVGVPRSRRFA